MKWNNRYETGLIHKKQDMGYHVDMLTGYRILSTLFFGMTGICLGPGIIPSLLSGTIGGVLGYLIPVLVLKRSGSEKARVIDDDLPYVIDLLTIAMLAGQNIYGAFKLLSSEYDGAASRELAGFNRDIDLGLGKAGAYGNLEAKKISKEFSDLIFILTQAEQYGSPLNEILKQKSQQIRFKNQELAEEKARKMSIYIMFPLVFLVLPSFILLAGGPLLFSLGTGLFG
ncbi:MAG: type II secretion system F family protein [Actinobacteria bacterium]|nr:type II secretion system F family protein [Actinomycetota bacterium]